MMSVTFKTIHYIITYKPFLFVIGFYDSRATQTTLSNYWLDAEGPKSKFAAPKMVHQS